MPRGQVAVVPEDGLTTRQRRNRPLLVVHTGAMKGKSTAAFGLAIYYWAMRVALPSERIQETIDRGMVTGADTEAALAG